MSDTPLIDGESLAPDLAERIDHVCNRFEKAWAHGEPRIEEFLTEVEARDRKALLRELVALDVYHRRRRGAPSIDYRQRFAELDATWLARLASPTEAIRATAPVAGARRFGDYELLAEIARGGMGIVYRARQISLDRPVALKMIRAGEFATPADLQRFRAEAENAARLDHPHIVPVYEVGAEAGQPFYAMKLIDGGSLAEVLPTFSRRLISTAKLMATVADAVDHAHRHGVLHRDLKPANILLDKAGRPHVADFGLAKRLESASDLTHSGALVGTPSYMAPEQAFGRKQLTTATDVYSLGAILFALLTGRPPFQGETVLDTLEMVRHREPPSPRKLSPWVSRDLATVCLKCLHKDPRQRYATAAALAEDLRHYLAGEPVNARPVGPVGRFTRWCRRRPAIAGLAATLALAVIVFPSALAVVQHIERKRTDEQRREADRNFERARDAVNQFLFEVTNDPLLKSHDLREVRKKLLQSALPFFEQLAAARPNDPRLRAEQGEAFLRLAFITREVGDLDESLKYVDRAHATFTQLISELPHEPRYHQKLSETHRSRGQVFVEQSKWRPALEAFGAASAEITRIATEHPENLEYQQAAAALAIDTGNVQSNDGRPEEAEGNFKGALYYLRPLVQQHPKVAQYKADLAGTEHNIGRLIVTLMMTRPTGRLKDAEEAFREALRLRKELVDENPGVVEYQYAQAQSQHHLAALLRTLSRFNEAEPAFEEAIRLHEKLVDRHSAVPLYREALAFAYTDQSGLFDLTKRLLDAEKACLRAIGLREQLAQRYPDVPAYVFNLGQSYVRLGGVMRLSGKFPEACDSYAKAIAQLEKALPQYKSAEHARAVYAECFSGRAQALTGLNKHAEALKDWDRSLELGMGLTSNWTRLRRALTRARLGDHAAAAAEADEVIAKHKPSRYTLSYFSDAARVLAVCAAAESKSGKTVEAEAHAARAVEFLGRAASGGFFSTPSQFDELAKDDDFAVLADRDGFRRLRNDAVKKK